mmetsp:Transcript_1941/g.2777  ORF Transcript_1941/g.2777 Transcript_1941/m.2777 type:complete len:317 (-) Transcript_1941:394-1344(-)|eukprot:CAMPEP_0184486664 /NCGR_PEP_ID=MMETSP0113_2-20130426/8137_1 /TAXON_ID=91329 /ORGANISM="Norrisiella sphaerica, Strain BC52" /LENGTH=316 /DNA_ID=CAMNT_0026868645 /DNA_START=123 /DNA_END=1073 /DNA_ORIENTATION=-
MENSEEWVLVPTGKGAVKAHMEVRITQVENPDYTHWMVKHSGLGITHSGVLIEVRTDSNLLNVIQGIVDLIVVDNTPYIAIRYFGALRRRWSLDPEKKWIRYYRKHTFDGGNKPWKLTRLEGDIFVTLMIDRGEWTYAEASKVHENWVEKIAAIMQSRVRDGFHILRRNCQHVAAWTINRVNADTNGLSNMKTIAVPPNFIFRMLSKDWLPEAIHERSLLNSHNCNNKLLSMPPKDSENQLQKNFGFDLKQASGESTDGKCATMSSDEKGKVTTSDLVSHVEQGTYKETEILDEETILSLEEVGWVILGHDRAQLA